MNNVLINLRSKPWPAHFVYVGRAFACFNESHELANPFPLTNDTRLGRLKCLSDYAKWLHALPDVEERLWRLWCDTESLRFPLACWCGEWEGCQVEQPLCHGAYLIDEMRKRWTAEPHDENA